MVGDADAVHLGLAQPSHRTLYPTRPNQTKPEAVTNRVLIGFGGRGGGGGRGRGGPPGRGGRGAPRGGRGGRGGAAGGAGGKKVIVEPHRHKGVFVARGGKEDLLATVNLVPGESVYGEKRISVENANKGEDSVATKTEYRVSLTTQHTCDLGAGGSCG